MQGGSTSWHICATCLCKRCCSLFVIGLSRLDLHRFDITNWRSNAVCVVLAGAFLVSFFANFTLFMDNAFLQHKRWASRVEARSRARGAGPFGSLGHLLAAIWLRRFVELAEALVLLVLLNGGLVVVYVLGIFNALSWVPLRQDISASIAATAAAPANALAKQKPQ